VPGLVASLWDQIVGPEGAVGATLAVAGGKHKVIDDELAFDLLYVVLGVMPGIYLSAIARGDGAGVLPALSLIFSANSRCAGLKEPAQPVECLDSSSQRRSFRCNCFHILPQRYISFQSEALQITRHDDRVPMP
jgi:hypothetical protein